MERSIGFLWWQKKQADLTVIAERWLRILVEVCRDVNWAAKSVVIAIDEKE